MTEEKTEYSDYDIYALELHLRLQIFQADLTEEEQITAAFGALKFAHVDIPANLDNRKAVLINLDQYYDGIADEDHYDGIISKNGWTITPHRGVCVTDFAQFDQGTPFYRIERGKIKHETYIVTYADIKLDKYWPIDSKITSNPNFIPAYIARNENGQYGFLNKYGELLGGGFLYVSFRSPREQVIGECRVSLINSPYKVIKDNKFGIINEKGELNPKGCVYDEIKEWSSYNHIYAKLNGKWGCVDSEDNVIVPFRWRDIEQFNEEGFVWVEHIKKSGLIAKYIVNNKGKITYPLPQTTNFKVISSVCATLITFFALYSFLS